MYIYALTYYNNLSEFVDTSRCKDENVIAAFAYLFYQLGILFGKVDFARLKSICIFRGTSLPWELKQQIRAAQEVDDILDALDDPLYCNWLNVRILKRISRSCHNQPAVELIQTYENSVYSRKASDVKEYFSLCFKENTVSLIEAEINSHHGNITVKQIIEFCEKIEKMMDIDVGTASVVSSDPGCLKITIVIPLYCSLHAFEMARKNFLKLRQFHIQYMEIESFPKVYALNYPDIRNSSGILSSSTPKCKLYLGTM